MFREPNISVNTPNGSRVVPMEDYLYNNRQFWLQGRITADLVDSLLTQLMIIEDDYRESGILDKTEVDVTIYIDSPGGSLTALNLYDYLKHTPLKVRTVVTGYAYSAAALIFLAGSERCMMPYSNLMFHEPNYACEKGIADEPIEMVEHITRNIKHLKDVSTGIIAEETGLTKAVIAKRITNRKWFIDAHQAIELNMADKIVHRL